MNSLEGTPIFRGVDINYKYMYTNPKNVKDDRKSLTSINIYNILFRDVLPSWKGWPKRDIICSTDASSTQHYGSPFRVFFKDGIKIGVCPNTDIWSCFRKSGIISLYSTFEMMFQRLIRASLKKDVVCIKNKKEMLKILNDLDNIKRDDNRYLALSKFFKSRRPEDIWKEWIENRDISLKDILNKYLDPKKNGFIIKKVGDNIPNEREVWSDSECVLISRDSFDIYKV